MNTTHETPLGRRSFLRRTAGITVGAAALITTALNTQTTLAAPTPTPAAVIEPATGMLVELFDMSTNTVLGWFTACTNIGSQSEIVLHKIMQQGGGTIIRKIPGRLQYFDITLTGGGSSYDLVAVWRNLVETGNGTQARRMVAINVYDQEGDLAFQWHLDGAWPAELVVHGDGQLVESLTIVCDTLVREK